ncbi:precorrin-6y C5,15-methyltransferase (decarboxylating) subunit CbiE [Amorphus orientalis]|uniref:Precorrin-6Y C5,15-methyltransferase (Decarboxylating) n=1 Tax=Amorphus orientalis TaxID=649198 RepID=A0AAE3VPB9_9HYPH|nr:precorrin-6y C5,15-methyltransferase (decarboxylating) subunit CbiE [Amorphus orientalis]MDQ0315680.1 precorrin-6Y C5,15-methyltransferase (decarboxylating) [Amorphus orientalis]
MADFSSTNAALSSETATAPWLSVVGIGEDGRDGLSAAAIRALEGARFVIGGKRHLALAGPLKAEAAAWPSPMTNAFDSILARRGEPVCVLATGDPFHHGVGSELARRVAPEEIVCFPQPSAFSLAAARMGWAFQDCVAISLHGRALARIVPYLTPRARILALSWDGTTPARLAEMLTAGGFGGSRLTVLERMGGPHERRRSALAAAFALDDIDPLNLIAVEIVADPTARVLPLTPGLDDAWFETDGQITKAETRALTLSALAPLPGERLWDIGAGSGSVSIEWTIRHLANTATAIEARDDRAARIEANAERFGADGLSVVRGQAPDILADVPPPDAVFIGGGLTTPGVFEVAWAALPAGGRLVANAVTIESEARLQALFADHGGEMRRLSVARLEAVGGMHGWRAAMPVTQWRVVKP